jgi:hypothetical protein
MIACAFWIGIPVWSITTRICQKGFCVSHSVGGNCPAVDDAGNVACLCGLGDFRIAPSGVQLMTTKRKGTSRPVIIGRYFSIESRSFSLGIRANRHRGEPAWRDSSSPLSFDGTLVEPIGGQ